MHRVHPHALARVFQRRRFGHQAHRALGTVVGDHARRADDAVQRGDVDDGAVTGFFQRRHRGFHAQPDAGLAHRDDVVETFQGFFLDALEVGEAGIVDQGGEAAVLLDGVRHHTRPVGFLGYIMPQKNGVAAAGLDGRHRLLAFGGEDVGDHDPGALGREQPRVRFADTARTAGDDGDLVLQSITHGIALGWL
jgi:hypothetical protein